MNFITTLRLFLVAPEEAHAAMLDSGLSSGLPFNFLNMRNYVGIKFVAIPRSEDAGGVVCWHITTSDSTAIKHYAGGHCRAGTTPWRAWIMCFAALITQPVRPEITSFLTVPKRPLSVGR